MCREQLPQFSLKNTDPKNCRYMDYMQESRATAACHDSEISLRYVRYTYNISICIYHFLSVKGSLPDNVSTKRTINIFIALA